MKNAVAERSTLAELAANLDRLRAKQKAVPQQMADADAALRAAKDRERQLK